MNRLPGWTLLLSGKKVVVATSFLAIGVFTISASVDRVFMAGSDTRCRAVMYVTNLVVALLAGMLFWTRTRDLQRRLEIVAGLNHNIRNALHAITLSTFLDSRNAQIIQESVDRIDRTLREFVPNQEI
ncbi:MAG: hypothetical protein AB7O65_05980 [Candidatus Korobacteraceae bacterium]